MKAYRIIFVLLPLAEDILLDRALKNICKQGKEDALKEVTVTEVDYEKICAEISAIRGIGDVRIEQIMDILRNNL